MQLGGENARVWELVQHRNGRAVVIGLLWWTVALGSIAVLNIPPTNRVAGMVVFGATVFGALCAVGAPLGLDRTLVAWVGTRLLAVAAVLGVVAEAVRATLFAGTPPAVAYTQTPAEIPAVVAGCVASFVLLYSVGAVLRVGARRRPRFGVVGAVRDGLFAGRTER
ncbi:hypothetical protein [Halogeometricum limi]|uniref:Uncharacterized protein n=1 Tax=Halogeometricum limi TaxID=555875 RepID=A0A1I6ILW3_9EURY|nr:hypothetical protein [Halogeometricum limi]SFR67693.1 hypothetical protein SAMN04488124_3392 [Halogeometricum limi]